MHLLSTLESTLLLIPPSGCALDGEERSLLGEAENWSSVAEKQKGPFHKPLSGEHFRFIPEKCTPPGEGEPGSRPKPRHRLAARDCGQALCSLGSFPVCAVMGMEPVLSERLWALSFSPVPPPSSS